MKFKNKTSILNYGDTSFRRKKYLSEYRSILRILADYMQQHDNWDNSSQSGFYEEVIRETDLFNRHEERTPDKMAKRGRTLTNSLVKTGLINSGRQISDVGKAWLDQSLKAPDAFEQLLGFSNDNLVFFRQWCKVRQYDQSGTHFFNPFLFILKLLSKYDSIPRHDFIKFVHAINPKTTEEQLNDLINQYSAVDSNKKTFEQFFTDNFAETIDNKTLCEVGDLLSQDPRNINLDQFSHYFSNGKSKGASAKLYLDFVLSLLQFKQDKSRKNLDQLLLLAKESKIKKAFGYGKNPFLISKSRNSTVSDFLKANRDSELLNGDNTTIYVQFVNSKKYDLTEEYGDMTVRLTNIAGVISYQNDIASLTLKPLFQQLFNSIDVKLTGDEAWEKYDNNLESDLYQNLTFTQILGISDTQVNQILTSTATNLKLSDPSKIEIEMNRQRDARFKKLVETKFPKSVVLSLLADFADRNDEEISRCVTDNAPIPDIFEYVLGLAWYYLSGKKVNIRTAFNMSLDADFLPLSHAAGYQGDLEIQYSNRVVLLEATLMDRNTQKRGEMEPVIRHTTNLAIEKQPVPVQTFFVANELDDNVVNIFRSTRFVELNHSSKKGSIKGVNIFALTIDELIYLLKKDVNDEQLISAVSEQYSSSPQLVKNGWREPVLQKISQ